MEEYSFTLTNTPAELQRVQRQIQAVLQAADTRFHLISAINLALGEWLENIIQYAYEDGGEHHIVVRCALGPAAIVVRVIDDGRPFNPCEYPALEAAAPAEQRAFAGRGIHLIRHLMDRVEHERAGTQNILVLTKQLR